MTCGNAGEVKVRKFPSEICQVDTRDLSRKHQMSWFTPSHQEAAAVLETRRRCHQLSQSSVAKWVGSCYGSLVNPGIWLHLPPKVNGFFFTSHTS